MLQRFRAQLILIAGTIAVGISVTSTTWPDDKPAAKEPDALLTRDQARKLKSPVSFSKASIARGQILYKRACTECHGADGKSLVDVVANATDLTNPKVYRSGTSAGEIFRSIRDGAGESMPPFAEKVSKEEDLWNMVNYVRSLWPESARPALEKGTPH
jgi:mono/diheme cytochrome c family protein